MYPAAIAEQLRRRGHDASAVTERIELRSLPDAAILAIAQKERRAVVTENIVDFVPLGDATEQRGTLHQGLVLVDPAKFPRGNPRITGRMVRELLKLLAEQPRDQPRSLRYWL
jgi:hypothetical protein